MRGRSIWAVASPSWLFSSDGFYLCSGSSSSSGGGGGSSSSMSSSTVSSGFVWRAEAEEIETNYFDDWNEVWAMQKIELLE